MTRILNKWVVASRSKLRNKENNAVVSSRTLASMSPLRPYIELLWCGKLSHARQTYYLHYTVLLKSTKHVISVISYLHYFMDS